VDASDGLAELELQFAKARFAEDYNCVAVRLSKAGDAHLLLHRARHPLLERNLKLKDGKIVPVSIEMEGDHRQLVITGPNTGGKTVSLKTLGLLALMAQSGIPVPADRADMPVFDAILADIGDYQSIEQNLSTFSAHMTNIDFISRTATANSLVLLDELGSATDPEEGAALAVAIAEHFRQVGCLSVISTHHTSLKVYGANTAGVINASVGFDESQLTANLRTKDRRPRRFGRHQHRAATGIESRHHRIGALATGLADAGCRALSGPLALRPARTRIRARSHAGPRVGAGSRKAATRIGEGRKEQQAKVRAMEAKLEALFRDFEYHARETVNAVQDRAAQQKLSKDAERRIARMRREFREQFDATVVAHATGADRGDPNAQPSLVKHVCEGDTVKLKSMGRAAVVQKKIGDHHFDVEIGSMKMRVAREDIAEVLASAQGQTKAQTNPVDAARSRGITVQLQNESSERNPPSEINVIGHTVDEATSAVEKFIDRAFLAGMPRVRIVHGSGMGILRKALRQYLQKHPHVESVTEPPSNEGGGGATVVELRV
jgi:DNA mismatch repair protein MutS2